jgi:hypothetical protein
LTDEELASKFADCASRSVTTPAATRAWAALMSVNQITDVRDLTALFTS